MSSGVFVLQKDGTLVEMSQRDYPSEDILQNLLAKYPNLLAGNLINESNPRKWILISREYSIPDKDESLGRWSIDHLFLDQDGIPTLVEVKRSSDTRIRREVVGQMLEYAANAVSYWNIDKIRLHFETRCETDGLDAESTWMETFQLEESYEDYWEHVNTNLQTGRIRMMFIADIIPLELRQIVEFLNEQMNPAEVLALEIKQYVGKDQSTLIPRIYGQSSKTQIKKTSSAQGRIWDKQSILEALREREGEETVMVAQRIMDWTEARVPRIDYGSGSRNGSYIPYLVLNGDGYWTYTLWTSGTIEIQFQYIKNQKYLGDTDSRIYLMNKLNTIAGVYITEDRIDKRPSIPFSLLYPQDELEKFFNIWDEYIDSIKKQYL